MFSGHLKDRIKKLEKELAREKERVKDLTNSKPLLYEVFLEDGKSVLVIADEQNWYVEPKVHHFYLNNRLIAYFNHVKYFTVKKERNN